MATIAPSIRPWYRRPRPMLGIAAVVLVLAAGGFLRLAWGARGAHEASMDDAISRFRAGANTTAPAALLVPDAGVYTYNGSGTERLSVLHASQHMGARMPATVTRTGNDCFSVAIEYSTHHSQTFDYCVRNGRLDEQGGVVRQLFDFRAFKVKETNTFVCTTPGAMVDPRARVGATSSFACDGSSSERNTTVHNTGEIVYLGRATLTVGGARVDTYAIHTVRRMSGDQVGTETADVWFAARTGMLVKLVRDTDVKSPSPIGKVRYTEHASLLLASTTPRR